MTCSPQFGKFEKFEKHKLYFMHSRTYEQLMKAMESPSP